MFPIIDKKETGINLRRIMDARGISAKDMQNYLGLGCVQSVYRWLEGENMPTIDNLYALSELFKVPIDTLVCGNRKPIAPRILVEVPSHQKNGLLRYAEKLHAIPVA